MWRYPIGWYNRRHNSTSEELCTMVLSPSWPCPCCERRASWLCRGRPCRYGDAFAFFKGLSGCFCVAVVRVG